MSAPVTAESETVERVARAIRKARGERPASTFRSYDAYLAREAIAAMPEPWRPIEEAPTSGRVLAGRFDKGRWIEAVVQSPPSKPFTVWTALPAPPAQGDKADGGAL